MPIQRGRIFNQGYVNVSAAKAWAYLTDWAGSNRQRSGANLGDLTLAKVVLEGRPDQIPRTRAMEFGALGVVRETLLHQDDATMHIYYNMEGTGPYGLTNYLATTDIDDMGPNLCQVTLSARFDIPEGGDAAKIKALIDLAHNQGVIGAMQRYFAAQ